MNNVTRFLALLSFLLLAVAGCNYSYSSVPTKVASMATAKKKPPGSDYEELVTDSPIARHMRGEPQKVPERTGGKVAFICVASGEFNLGDKADYLLMETLCVEQQPIAGQGIHILPVNDKHAPRIKGKSNIYRIPFKSAVISVISDDVGQPEVTLHYRDEKRVLHHVVLPPQPGAYRYSFISLAKEGLEPLGDDIRMLQL